MANGIKVKVGLVGLDQVRGNIMLLGKQGKEAFRSAMYAQGLAIIDDATANAPAVTSRLRNSHFVSWPDKWGNVTLGFGVKYAAAVEFGIHRAIKSMSRKQQKAAWAKHNEDGGWKKSPTGGPSYFRNAINKAKSGMANRVAKWAKMFFEMGTDFKAIPTDVPQKSNKGKTSGS